MNKKFLSLYAMVLACNGMAAQQQQNDSIALQRLDEVVISDSRFALKRENSGKTVIKITAEELERNQGRTVAEIINTKSGLEINGSRGREGNILGIFARGGRGKQVLVVVDGVRVSDPSTISSEYDLRLLSVANIESIEIIKGAASTLYGTNAATAVINITTKKASAKAISGNFQSTIGTQQSVENQNYNGSEFTNSALINGTLNDLSYSLGFTNRYANGLSDFITPENEKDPYSNYSLDLKLGYQFSKKFDFQVYANQTKLNTAYDDSFARADAPYFFNSEQERVGIATNYAYNDNGSLHINAAYSEFTSQNISAFPNAFEGNNYALDFFNKYTFNKQFYTILGINYIQDESKFLEDKKITITDPYANFVYVSSFGLNLNAGARINNNSEYGTNLVYNFNPSYTYNLDNGYIKAMSSYATSYITPSLTQLYGFFGANPDLQPEENSTLEGGLEYSNSNLRVSALYFNRDENNPIIFDGANGYQNSEGFIDAQGLELELDWNFNEAIRWTANYTFTERKGDNAIRIPKHKANTSFDVALSKATFASLNYSFVGKRLDTDFTTFSDVTLNAFSLVNLYFSHSLLDQKLKVFLNMDNLLNEDFVETIGFTTRGRNVRIGFNLTL
jgi:vitamin B12 transporter